jgi:probable rRNA maturation factor
VAERFEIEIADQQTCVGVDQDQLAAAARLILEDHGPATARISIALVDDPTIHALNRQYLNHDYPTDVLSFVLEHERDFLEGEIVVSGETALNASRAYGWEATDELLLYVVHGMLHLVGFDDRTAAARAAMRRAERDYLRHFGLERKA